MTGRLAAGPGGFAGSIQLVRQPVFDAAGEVRAHELVTRGDALLDAFASLDDSAAAAKLLADAFLEMDVWSLTGGLPVHLRVPSCLLVDGVVGALPTDLTFLQLDGDGPATPQLVDACRALRAAGYRLALSSPRSGHLDRDLLGLVDLVKLDVGRLDGHRLAALCAQARRAGRRVVADQVDSRPQESAARLMGFDGYQGRFFQQPALISGRRLGGSRLAFLQLLRAANAVDIDYDQVADIIKRDVALAWKFLNYINAAHFGWQRRIESITQGLVLLGQNGVRRWVSLMVVTELGDGRRELTEDAITRARLCEQLSGHLRGATTPLSGFLVGMFSLLDAMMDAPLPDLLGRVSLPDDVVGAILHGEGSLGMLLGLVVAYERGAWGAVEARSRALGLATGEVTRAYLDALGWALGTLGARGVAAS